MPCRRSMPHGNPHSRRAVRRPETVEWTRPVAQPLESQAAKQLHLVPCEETSSHSQFHVPHRVLVGPLEGGRALPADGGRFGCAAPPALVAPTCGSLFAKFLGVTAPGCAVGLMMPEAAVGSSRCPVTSPPVQGCDLVHWMTHAPLPAVASSLVPAAQIISGDTSGVIQCARLLRKPPDAAGSGRWSMPAPSRPGAQSNNPNN
jgi:hypothetical protein